MEPFNSKKKATFNLSENTLQGLKLLSAARKRDLADLVEEALATYMEWNRMTKIERDELGIYRFADKYQTSNFDVLRQHLQHGPNDGEFSQLLDYLDANGFLAVELNDDKTGFKQLAWFPDRMLCVSRISGAMRLNLTIPGRVRFQQLQAREEWENSGTRLERGRWIEKAAAFRAERIAALEKDRSFVALVSGPRLVLHCIPLESFANNASHDVFGLDGTEPMCRWRSDIGGWGMRINLEGSICVALGEPTRAYTQMFRTGAIEAVRVGVLECGADAPSSARGLIPSSLYEETVVRYVPYCLQRLRKLGCTTPVLVGISLIGVKGLTLAGASTAIERNVLVLPEVVVEDFASPVSALLKPALDVVWNACGLPASQYFDADGNWNRGADQALKTA